MPIRILRTAPRDGGSASSGPARRSTPTSSSSSAPTSLAAATARLARHPEIRGTTRPTPPASPSSASSTWCAPNSSSSTTWGYNGSTRASVPVWVACRAWRQPTSSRKGSASSSALAGARGAVRRVLPYDTRSVLVDSPFCASSCPAHCIAVLMADPNWNRGFYYDGIPPHTGMKLARRA
jgi:hypothetical protein